MFDKKEDIYKDGSSQGQMGSPLLNRSDLVGESEKLLN
uniref:Uncharacterized protein n=1 Tax=Gloeothece verrucosa (strain PCC 7822) TaxID=497965 RepID=E0UMZ8_GLOV7|nr:hypothetical protein Cyan7822_6568 [Gloeothece verrucosa PCC 7822]